MKWNQDGRMIILLWVGLDQLLGFCPHAFLFSPSLFWYPQIGKIEKTAVFPLKGNSLLSTHLLLLEKGRLISGK